MTRTTPNGTTVVEDTFVLDGLRARREATSGGPFEPLETVWLHTIDGARVVAYWLNGRGLKSGAVCHFRDKGETHLGNSVELEDLVDEALRQWPAYALAGARKPSTQVNA